MSDIKYEFSNEDMESFKPTAKIGLIATVNEEGLPHVTMITSMQAKDSKELLVGEFYRGRSKEYIRSNPHMAFLILSLQMKLWRGNAFWTHSDREGPEYEIMNQIPMFRYNTYFGINTVHYFDLKGFKGPKMLPLPGIVLEILKSKMMKGSLKSGNPDSILRPFIKNMINQLTSFTFLAYIKPDGYPELIPLLQCQAADNCRLIFSKGAFRKELAAIPDGEKVAVFTMNLNMESVLVRGTYKACNPSIFGNIGSVDIDWVYNSMPPATGQIYPELEVSAVTDF